MFTFTGELGWEFYVENSRAVKLYKAVMKNKEKYNISHIGGYAINSMRIEKGFRLWGAEVKNLFVVMVFVYSFKVLASIFFFESTLLHRFWLTFG